MKRLLGIFILSLISLTNFVLANANGSSDDYDYCEIIPEHEFAYEVKETVTGGVLQYTLTESQLHIKKLPKGYILYTTDESRFFMIDGGSKPRYNEVNGISWNPNTKTISAFNFNPGIFRLRLNNNTEISLLKHGKESYLKKHELELIKEKIVQAKKLVTRYERILESKKNQSKSKSPKQIDEKKI